MKITIFSDGGARGNPGPAGIGCVIRQRDEETKRQRDKEISRYIGEATNNQAEYRAVIEALKWIKETERQKDKETKRDLEIEFFLDSELVVEQLNQRYKVKNEGLKPLFWQVRDLIFELGGRITFRYISREKNKEADRLVNQAIDKRV